MMTIVARGMTEIQVRDVAAWYASHTAAASLTADPAQAPDHCVACHGADGIATYPDTPNLAAQTVMYIDTQLKAFRSGKRVHDLTGGIAPGLTDADIRAAAEWYAAVGLTVTPPE